MRPRKRQEEGGIYLTLASDASDFSAYTDERTLKRTFTTITSDDLLERYVSFELTNAMFHYPTDDMRRETFFHLTCLQS